MEQAQRYLQERQPGQVLTLLDGASATCPTTNLGQERLTARILALCQMGRTGEAHRETERLERESPHATSLDRIHAECP